MTVRITLTKMHGARNDFLILDGRATPVKALDALARTVCDRRSGIGADGLIAIEKANGAGAGMRIINADGGEAEMCGNGVRCAARWLDERGEGDRIVFATNGGAVQTNVIQRTPEYLVCVDMPAPRVVARSLEGLKDAVAVEVGNPHVVVFQSNVETFDLEGLARSLQSDRHFPGGVNVHAASIEGAHHVRVRHWERGVGETPACGTGAVAVAVAAIDAGRMQSPVDVAVAGGTLTVQWDGRNAPALIGPAVRVFETEIDV